MYYIDAEPNYPTVFILDSWTKFPVIFFDCKHRSLRNCFLFFVHHFGTICCPALYWVTIKLDQNVFTICPLCAHCVPTVSPAYALHVSSTIHCPALYWTTIVTDQHLLTMCPPMDLGNLDVQAKYEPYLVWKKIG